MRELKKSTQSGLGLVELMVGITVGLFVVLAGSSVYLTAVSSSADSNRASRLNQDVRTILDIMTQDLHRAGNWGGAGPGASNNPFSSRTAGVATDIFISADNSCILYSYDVNQDGTVASDGSEFFGFRYNSDTQEVEVLNETTAPDTSAVTGCGALSWLPLNRSTEVIVSALSFSTENSRCIAFEPTTFNAAVAATYTEWQLTGTNSAAACETLTASGTTTPVGTALPAGVSFDATLLTGRGEVRQITIRMTATSTQDSSFTRTQTETVRVRNDRVS